MDGRIVTVAISALILKLCLLPLAQTVDADAVSRIYLSIEWINDPKWIETSVWAPFHFYLTGGLLGLWDDPIYAPKVLNILLSILTIFPIYYFTKREFNHHGAFFVAVLFALSPILFRNSFMALSETPYLLFLAFSLNLVSKSIRERLIWPVVLAGICMTIASGFRYEAWLLMAIFGTLLLFVDWKKAMIFGAFSLIFPIIWMYSNYVAIGNPLFSINGNYKWTMEVMNNNASVDTETLLRRIWFFPIVWFVSVGPPAAFLILRDSVGSLKKWKVDRLKALFALLFFIMLLFFVYNSIKGVLLLQHRFIGTLVILGLPFLAASIKSLNWKKLFLFSALLVGLTYVYNMGNIQPVPRLKDQTYAKMYKHIPTGTEHLVIDNFGWAETYFTALRSELPQSQITLSQQYGENSEVIRKTINLIDSARYFTLILNPESELAVAIEMNKKQLRCIHREKKYVVYGR